MVVHPAPPLGDEIDLADPETLAWLPSIEAADAGDLRPLVAKLNSTGIGWCKLIADLLARHQNLRRKPGGQTTPIYRTAEVEAAIHTAVKLLRLHPKYRSDRNSALYEVASQFRQLGVTPGRLENANLGKLRSMRRLRRRASRS